MPSTGKSTAPTAQTSPAQAVAPDAENGRYTFSQTPDGLLRLDTRSGHVSLCTKRAAGWACQIVPDERAALETEIARLQTESVTLKKELINRGIPLPNGTRAPDAGDRSNDLVLKLPNDADLERAMGVFEKIWRRLVEMVQGIQRNVEKKN